MKNWLQRMWAFLFTRKKKPIVTNQLDATLERLQMQNRSMAAVARSIGKPASTVMTFDRNARRHNEFEDGYAFRDTKPVNFDNDAGVTFLSSYSTPDPDPTPSHSFDGGFGGGGYSGASSGGSWEDNNSSSNDYGSSSDSSSDYSSSDSGSTNWD